MLYGEFVKEDVKPLLWWVENLTSMSRDVWLWVPKDTIELQVSTPCFPVNSSDLSPEEQGLLDSELERQGWLCFFYKDKIEDIVSNLHQQKPTYVQADLFQALNFYWQNDAFINLEHV